MTDDLLARADRLRTGRTPFVLATVVRAQRPTSARPGDRALVLPDGTVEGFVGGSCAECTVRDQGLRVLASGESELLRITPTEASGADAPDDGVLTVDNPCGSGGTLEIFLEAMLPPPLVVVLGNAPVAQALVRVGAALDYDVRASTEVTEILEGADAVLVASHGRGEVEVLRAALAAQVRYVALVASPRRGAAVLARLGLPEEQTARVSVPAGLDIGARTAGEIALSVYAEFVALRRSAGPAAVSAGAESAQSEAPGGCARLAPRAR